MEEVDNVSKERGNFIRVMEIIFFLKSQMGKVEMKAIIKKKLKIHLMGLSID